MCRTASIRLTTSFAANVAWFKDLLTDWLPRLNQFERGAQPLSALKIALQCGGSDAFSGISRQSAGGLGGEGSHPLRRRGESGRD